MQTRASAVLFAALCAARALALDHPIAGDRLSLKDPANDERRSVRFEAARDPAIDPTASGDPTVLGATLEIAGTAPGDGSSGPITLAASGWTALGNPPGSKGYRFVDPTRASGIRRVVFKPASAGGTLTVTGGGPAWPYAITQPQGAVDVRVVIGGDVYCARFTTFTRNEPGVVTARGAAAPPSCGTAPTSTTVTVPSTTTTTTATTTTTTTTSTTTTTTTVTTTTTTLPSTTTTSPSTSTTAPSTTTTTSTSTTTIVTGCGDGIATGTEECDDGNTAAGDGCSPTCQLESANPAVCAGVPSSGATSLDTVRIASGLEAPVHVAAPRLDPRRVFIVEQPGRIRVVLDGVLLAAPFLAIEGIVNYSGEQGLLSVAFDPNYESNRFFYVYYVNDAGNLVIARYQATLGNPNDADEGSEHVIVTIPHPTNANHNGGNLNFNPIDGFLYAATGDGGSGGDPPDNAQNDASLLGKLLRIDVATDAVTVWAKGLRNPWRWSFDRANGDIYIGDVGQGAFEEVSHRPAPNPSGANYGWDIFEGRHCFEPAPHFPDCASAAGLTVVPVLEYCNSARSDPACDDFHTDSDKGQAVTGGFVYRGCALPGLRGTYFYADAYVEPGSTTCFIRSFQGVAGGDAQNPVDRTADLDPPGALAITAVTSFGEDARGELYLTDIADGEVYKIVPGS